ncbi:MAG TPA: adenylosuccinate synthase, partial [Alphaproteobacteria bacterium]|nr:adenylosuccinate synthase [Alphaproteobacteria bacterium]
VHSMVDNAREALRGEGKIGTTGRGIGPAYEDKVARRGIRMADLLDREALREKVGAIADHHNVWLDAAGVDRV